MKKDGYFQYTFGQYSAYSSRRPNYSKVQMKGIEVMNDELIPDNRKKCIAIESTLESSIRPTPATAELNMVEDDVTTEKEKWELLLKLHATAN